MNTYEFIYKMKQCKGIDLVDYNKKEKYLNFKNQNSETLVTIGLTYNNISTTDKFFEDIKQPIEVYNLIAKFLKGRHNQINGFKLRTKTKGIGLNYLCYFKKDRNYYLSDDIETEDKQVVYISDEELPDHIKNNIWSKENVEGLFIKEVI